MIPLHLDRTTITILDQIHHGGPIGARLVAVVVLVGHVSVDHDVHLVRAVGVDCQGPVVAVRDVGPDRGAEGADFLTSLGLLAVHAEFAIASDRLM